MNLSKVVYTIFHPLLLCAYSLILGALIAGSLVDTLIWIVAVSAVFLLPIYVVYKVIRRQGADRQEARMKTSIVGVVLLAICTIIGTVYGAPQTLLASLYAAVVGSVVVALLSRYVELSLHAIILAGVAITTALHSLPTALIIVPLALLVSWAVKDLEKAPLSAIANSWGVIIICVVVIFYLTNWIL